MCISNIGNRRPFPTNGFKRRGDWDTLDASARKLSWSSQSSLKGKSHSSSIHIVVQHNYHDHAQDSSASHEGRHAVRGGVMEPFPLKLHDMLETVVANGHEDVVSWQPHGRCFVVHKPKEFTGLLPRYFKLSKLASFQRQLNLYGFQRLTKGRDRGGYYHELFLKGRVFLAHNIQRVKVKGTGVRARSNPDQEPDFWAMPWVEKTGDDEQLKESPGCDHHNACIAGAGGEPSICSLNGSSLPQHRIECHTRITSPPASGPVHDDFSSAVWPSSFFLKKFPAGLEPNAFATFPMSLQKPLLKTKSETCLRKVIDPGDKLLQHMEEKYSYDEFETIDSDKLLDNTPDTLDGVDELLSSEADAFFEDFDFPDDIGNEVEDDKVFGDLLEHMIA